MTKLAVTTDPIMLWMYCQNNHGFRSNPARLVSRISPFFPSWYPVGCCIQASVAIMKKPESHEPAKTRKAANQCAFGPRRFSPNRKTPDRKSEEHTSELQSLRHLVCR